MPQINKSPLWESSPGEIETSNMTRFAQFAERKTGKSFAGYSDLYAWSVNNISEFWEAIWQFGEVIFSRPYRQAFTPPPPNDRIPRGNWFGGAGLNFAENLLRFRDNRIAIISYSEGRDPVRITYRELYERVVRCANGLKEIGVGPQDRIAGLVTNIPEAIIAMLAATSLGAVWSSCSPDFGIEGALSRFGQIRPKVLFAVNSYAYNGKHYDCSGKINNIANNIDTLEKIIIIHGDGRSNIEESDRFITWDKLCDNDSMEIEFAQMPFDHPVYIMYSSGTTGKPKSIVHGAGGTLLQHIKELQLHTNLRRDSLIMYFTTCGWMMWNWLVSSLQSGAGLFLFDGSPGWPDLNVLWKTARDEGITIFGTSPKFLTSCQKSGIRPKNDFDLSKLEVILSTGSPLSEENYKWVYANVNEDVRLSSIAGGTDIISCFMLGNPNLPVLSGKIQCLGLGMKVEAWDDSGRAVIDEKAELVCSAPFPSMPVYFWNDPDNIKYYSSYFNYFDGVWRHGDFIEICSSGGIIIHGRSDATLNPGGVRIGTSEIYSIVEAMYIIEDSIIVGIPKDGDVVVMLFVVMADGKELDNDLINEINNTIRENATPRHVPDIIKQIDEVPVTISGKKVELAVAKIINGKAPGNISAIANPESLEQFRNI